MRSLLPILMLAATTAAAAAEPTDWWNSRWQFRPSWNAADGPEHMFFDAVAYGHRQR